MAETPQVGTRDGLEHLPFRQRRAWSGTGFGPFAGMGKKSFVKTPSDQTAGALLAGGMEKLLAAHVNARVGTLAPGVVAGRAAPVNEVRLSPRALTMIATPVAATAADRPCGPCG
jgi:hypothetical protein